jgi:hypothetical protein
MVRMRELFTLAGTAALLACCVIAVSPNYAAAQSADSSGAWQSSPGSQAPAVKSIPFDFSGCYSGETTDNIAGMGGTGFIDFVQHKKHITKGTIANLTLANQTGAQGPVTGNVKGATFKLQHVGHHCKVALVGGADSNLGEITGTYKTGKKCLNDGVKHTGTFVYEYDMSGNSCQ